MTNLITLLLEERNTRWLILLELVAYISEKLIKRLI